MAEDAEEVRYEIAVLKQKLKLLRTAYKEEQSAKQLSEIELANATQKIEEQASEIQSLKERNLELYDRNIELEELTSHQTTVAKVQATQQKPKTDNNLMQEIMNLNMLLGQEKKEKERLQQIANSAQEQLAQMQNEIERINETNIQEQSSLNQQITLFERKTKATQNEIEMINSQLNDKDREISQLKSQICDQESKLDQLSFSLHSTKEELVERENQIEQLMLTLSEKGEEAGHLAERLVELKNHLLDQAVFEQSFHVLKVAEDAKIQPFELVLSFVRDSTKMGEFFLQLQSQQDSTRKLIPIMAIALLDTKDSIKFEIKLNKESADCCFDDQPIDFSEQAKPKQQSTLLKMFSFKQSLSTGLIGQKFPMQFTSEHLVQIIKAFRKVVQMAHEKKFELEQRQQSQGQVLLNMANFN